ncbi:hypothetical protein C7M84_015759 [Penaeus vannamei]|uniref:Uncharacterized protein n=1 Tax=Penaeus vannamei TaxID=6689 RepID=A0A423SPV3_PENVA|nr:hypothetical protein C7M84_015759 [Penaeus vannamei]
MSTRIAYFEALRNNCSTMECMRRVSVCHNFVFKSLAFSAKYHPLAVKCTTTYTDPALVDFCAHVAVGDYKANGTMRTEVLKSRIEKYFCDEYSLLGDILARFPVCDSGLQGGGVVTPAWRCSWQPCEQAGVSVSWKVRRRRHTSASSAHISSSAGDFYCTCYQESRLIW